MSRRGKRTSLEAILGGAAEQAAPSATTTVAPVPSAAIPKKVIKQQTVYLPMPVYEQLRRLAFEERVKMHALLMEGLDRVFRDRGLASLDELRPSSTDEG